MTLESRSIITCTTERMSDQFMKLHMTIGKFPITLHHFTGPDVDGPHDHPFSFFTTIIAGSYVEEVWGINPRDRLWHCRRVHRYAGNTHFVHGEDIHRIVELPDGECITSVKWCEGIAPRRQPRFWRFDNGVASSRQWDEQTFVPYRPE